MKHWRVLLLVKRSLLEIYRTRERLHIHEPGFVSRILSHPKAPGNLADRHRRHHDAVQSCKEVLERRPNLHWQYLMREELQRPIQDVDLVVTVGGDGTLLQASHYLDDSIPVLGVNSDPTMPNEVEERLDQYDATRSLGYLCAATAETFEQVLSEVLDQRREPAELNRIRSRVDGVEIGTLALNDILVAHPNPAAVSRCSFWYDFIFILLTANTFPWLALAEVDSDYTSHLAGSLVHLASIRREEGAELLIPEVHSRSSGIRICTATGSTAAMQSAGGSPMTLLSRDLQYMVREPISPHPRFVDHLRGWLKPHEVLQLRWVCRRGVMFFDGSHECQEIRFGSILEFSSKAPVLRAFVRPD